MAEVEKLAAETFSAVDPTVEMAGRPLPALTTLLHRVCDNDPAKFEEACRIIELISVRHRIAGLVEAKGIAEECILGSSAAAAIQARIDEG